MERLYDQLHRACAAIVEKTGKDNDLCKKVTDVTNSSKGSSDNKKFLADVKQILQANSSESDVLLKFLIPLYLSIGNKNAAKKVLSSYFQGLACPLKDVALELLREKVQELCDISPANDSTHRGDVRHVVDVITALMDNFPLGEACITAESASVVTFLAIAQSYFFQLFRQGGQSAVEMNSTMHNCHVTMQALNRLTQRHLPKGAQLLQRLSSSLLAGIVEMDVLIMLEDQMMVDCRCCCAISLILLIQMSAPDFLPQLVKHSLEVNKSPQLTPPSWMQTATFSDLTLTSLTPMAALALLWGMVSMLDSSVLTATAAATEKKGGGGEGEKKEGENDSLVCEMMLKRVMEIDIRCHSTASRVQCIKTVTLWTQRILGCVKDGSLSDSVHCRLQGQGHMVQQLFSFVWTHWRDQLDVIRQNSRVIFDTCLKLHKLASKCDDVSCDPFLLGVLTQVLAMDWGDTCKFSALTCLVPYLGPSPILHTHPCFPATLLTQMTDQAVACHASELYEVLIGGDKAGGGAKTETDMEKKRDWLTVWIDPIITHLCSSDKKLKQHIIEYILPKVMKKDKQILEYMLKRLSSARHTGTETLGALIVCLRRARAWGLLTETLHTVDTSADVWTNIRSALSNSDEQVRLDAFALLCESKRTAETVRHVELDHVGHFLLYNLNNQTPAFRQAMTAFTKKLFFRINESQQALLRQRKRKQKVEEATAALEHYHSFLSWMEGYLFCQLYPTAAFARRTMSLSLLSLMVNDIHTDKDGEGYRPLGGVTANHIHTLLECMTDTFEENKQEAFKLLLVCTSMHPSLLTEEECRALYTSALQLAVSTRPQDCGTAAYLFRLLLHQPCFMEILNMCPPVAKDPSNVCGNENMETSKHNADDNSELHKLMKEMTLDDVDTSPMLRLLQSLLTLLTDQVTVAKVSLIVAAANRPIYPTLHCIRYVLADVDFKSVDKQAEQGKWQRFISCLLQVCLQVAAVVSPVVQNSSPEGNVPEEAVLGPGLKFDAGVLGQVEESRQTVALMPEYLVVCCWRSIKETSLLLGHLSLHLPVSRSPVDQGLLSFPQMEEIGVYFKQQLMESLHRGAFELAYAGFVMMCQRLWKSPWSDLQMLPRQWLEEVMSAITSSDESSALCATRRSAGVPFFIQAIVATETASSGRPSFHRVMTQLLNLALASASATSTASTDGQVHALNILRTLFKDTRLGEDVALYVCDGMKAAILGFKSKYWEVRNSATLLLSALMTRVFGVKRSKDDSVLSKRNSQTGRAFFHKYPDLYPFLLQELDTATHNMGSSGHLHLHPSLYPVLMVLGRLFPSTMEGNTTKLNLAAFIPYVIRCSSSPVYKTRMMAARALQPLVSKEQVTEVVTSLLTSLPAPPHMSDCGIAHSHLHGILLQVYHTVSLTTEMSGATLHTLMSASLSGWATHIWLISRQNPCPCTRQTALDITDIILSRAAPILPSLPSDSQHDFDAISQHFTLVLHQEVFSPPPFTPHTPFLSYMLSTVAQLALKYLCVEGEGKDEVTLKLLAFSHYEVHLSVLDWLLGGENGDDVEGSGVRTSGGGVGLSKEIVDRLLEMGLHDEGHPETVQKVFELLVLKTAGDTFLDNTACCEVFEKVLLKCHKERRSDVKAALIEFTGCLVPAVYYLMLTENDDSNSKGLQLVQDWSQLLSASCDSEHPDDLHLSCAKVIRDNCLLLLVDRERRLGSLVFEFWATLVTLLQADDLEVKDIAASVSSKLDVGERDGTHPEQALELLIGAMFHYHGNSKLVGCLTSVLRWVMPQISSVDEGTERLFDKGELNTFQDDINLACVVTRVLKHIFQPKPTLTSQDQHAADTSSPHSKFDVTNLTSQTSLIKHLSLISPEFDLTTALSEASWGNQDQLVSVSEVEIKGSLCGDSADSSQWCQLVQQVQGLLDKAPTLPSLNDGHCVFVKGCVYSEQTLFLTTLALMAHNFHTLEEGRTRCEGKGEQVKGGEGWHISRTVAQFVKRQSDRLPSGLLLQSLVQRLVNV